MSDSVSVTVLPDGPLKISGAKRVKFCGEPIESEGDVILCRCGESANAPFCDGSHARVGFSGERDSKEPKEVREWEGNTLRTFFNPNTCMHAFYCKSLGGLRERELAGDAEAATQIMRVVGTCPSGALTYETKAEVPEAGGASFDADIEIMEGGEVRLQCAFDIDVPLNERQREERATLCRCGLSNSKPWCDGQHKKKDGFR
jgi:CDGSH-type Zn-finger protein